MLNPIRAESLPDDATPAKPQVCADTVPVAFAVRGVEAVAGAGRLVALAIVAVEVSGIEWVMQGIQVVRDRAGNLQVRAPMFRHPASGLWVPAVILPDALRDALGAEILAMMRPSGQE